MTYSKLKSFLKDFPERLWITIRALVRDSMGALRKLSLKRIIWLIFALALVFIVVIKLNQDKKDRRSEPESPQIQRFVDSFLGIELNYPKALEMVRNPVEKSLQFYSADRKYQMVICLTDKTNLNKSCTKGNYRGEKTEQKGGLSLQGREVPREQVVKNGRLVEIYYSKDPVAISDKFFAATILVNRSKVSEEEIDLNEWQKTSEAILASIKFISE